MRSVAAEIASCLQAWGNCIQSGNKEWQWKHREKLEQLIDSLPSGSGIDCGTKLDWEASTPNKLVFLVDFHHMNDVGYYDGWTEHKLIVTPEFEGLSIRITGRNRNDIKEYLGELYHYALGQPACVEST